VYCRDFALGAARQIEANYVKTGKINMTYKYYPVVDQGRIGESNWAAQAAECANQQGKFWEYHDKLFAVSSEGGGTFTKPRLKQYAEGVVPDAATFSQCVDTDKTASIVQADIAEAQRLGVQGTPTFFVNNRLLNITSLDYGQFQRTFDTLVNKR